MMYNVHTRLISLFVVAFVCKTGRLQTTGDVRLSRGDGRSTGIVQLYSNTTWYTLCGHNFDSVAANVACSQLGFSSGIALPQGAFGEFLEMVPYPEQFQECSSGNEQSLMDCRFSGTNKCTPHRLAYANVKCSSDTSSIPESTLELDSTKTFPESGYLSPILVYKHGTWGHVCGEFWDDLDADVVCRQLGFSGGVAAYGDGDWTVPMLVTDIKCAGSDTKWDQCAQNDTFCYNGVIGSVFCYQNLKQGPTFSLVGGKAHYGKVVLTVDGQSGLICSSSHHDNTVTTWSYKEAYAVCSNLGYNGGYVLEESFDAGDVNEIFLEGVSCDTGNEDSLFKCKHNGWKNISTNCQSAEMAVSVYCYTSVRLTGSDKSETEDLLMGRVEVYNNTRWHGLCADVITQDIAVITCGEFGFTEAEILLPGTFGYNSNAYESVSSITCKGTEKTIADCTYTIGRCSTHKYHAALVCKRASTNQGLTVLPMDESYYGLVYIERYGLVGKVCLDGWDDVDASVLCRQVGHGHHSGIAMSYRPPYTIIDSIWATQVTCDGTESTLADCRYETNMASDWQCADNRYAAGALCFLKAPPDKLVRLESGKSPGHGRAEVYNDITGWGTICNSGWSNTDAAVFCRQAGYADGQTHPSAWKTAASDDVVVVLSGVTCDGTETSIYECGNKGWLSSSPCSDHTTDAGVYCYTFVNLNPGVNYGAVQYHTGEQYGVVCADGFDGRAATVVCKGMGYLVGMPLCCSAFGPLGLEFSMTDVSCVGDEHALTDCSFNEGNTCSSGQYASVVCGYSISTVYTKVSADPIVQINYNSHDGLICSEKFTHADAKVVCGQVFNGMSYGKAFKASAKAKSHYIRWLNGLGCDGNEARLDNCGPHDWGQIGVCSWDSVAAVICSNNEGDLDFDIRIVNGSQTTGRVEIKVKGAWGTMSGTDLTRQEVLVICRETGFHGGINLAPGSYGSGSGNVILTSISCLGNESSFEECVWSGYDENSQPRDHSKDAAVRCFYNTQLVGSTIVNYGRLEMYDSNKDEWYAVCDGNMNLNNAQVICQQMGYASGMFQKGSALGPSSSPINIVDIDCSQSSECTFTTGSCYTGKYLTLYCNDQPMTSEDLDVKLPLSSYYGPVSVKRFGLWGHVCSVGFDELDAHVVCSQLGYKSGVAVHTFRTSGHPIIQGRVRCIGDEATLSMCSRGLFAEDTDCFQVETVAGVICYNITELSFGSGELDFETGVLSTRVEVQVDLDSLYVSNAKFSDSDAAVYCHSLGYAGGEAFQDGFGSFGISDLSCTGQEGDILQCPATWDPEKTQTQIDNLAGVRCFTAVRLLKGDPSFYGAVRTSKGVETGLVCADNFDSVDAGTVCRSLYLEKGLALCCAPFGTINEPALVTNVTCTESSRSLTQCSYDSATGNDCQLNYAAVVCYNGQKPTDYTLNFETSSSYSGNIVVTYLGVNGSICMDNWDDNDAHVACRELGYSTGIAYNAARMNEAPYWISDVHCTGSESKLSECRMTSFGDVVSCTSKFSHAGVLCYENEGLYAKLAGTDEARYGRVEIAIDGQWQSVCNTHWDNKDGNVVCKMLNYRTGEAYHGEITKSTTGPVWDINFMCTGDETSLTECLSSGWRAATSVSCAGHDNDAAVFCYKSVKLSTGVGRETDQGAVLLYMDDRWYSVCADGFTQKSASVVCKELGFRDGQVQTGSKYGPLEEYERLDSHKMTCTGDETDTYDCLTEGVCEVSDYASVVCYEFELVTEEPTTNAPEVPTFDPLPIIIGVIVAVSVIIIFVIVFYVLRKYRQRKAARMPFEDFIVRRTGDGSVHISNPLQQTPETPRAQLEEHNKDVNKGCNNPNYSVFRNGTEEQVGVSQPVNNGVVDGATLNVTNTTGMQDDGPNIYDSIKSEGNSPHYTTMLPENADVKLEGDSTYLTMKSSEDFLHA